MGLVEKAIVWYFPYQLGHGGALDRREKGQLRHTLFQVPMLFTGKVLLGMPIT